MSDALAYPTVDLVKADLALSFGRDAEANAK
jgi:hypothetical protein